MIEAIWYGFVGYCGLMAFLYAIAIWKDIR
jgi:hypothetical protein